MELEIKKRDDFKSRFCISFPDYVNIISHNYPEYSAVVPRLSFSSSSFQNYSNFHLNTMLENLRCTILLLSFSSSSEDIM